MHQHSEAVGETTAVSPSPDCSAVPISPTDPGFAALFGQRTDAESLNQALDDTLWLRRAHSVGYECQHLTR